MQIERNLHSQLRSLIERVVEDKEEFASSEVLVDKDKGRRNQEQKLDSESQSKEEEHYQPAETKEVLQADGTIKTVLAHRLDLMA